MNKNASPNRRPVRPIALLLALLLAGSMTGCAFRLGRQATVSPAEQPKAAIEDTPQNISPSG